MFAWFQRLLPRTGDFFGMFEAHAATLIGAAEALNKLADGGPGHKDNIAEVHRFEHEADDIIREVLRTVRRTFLTPFDRGAITSLIGAMDDAVDEMQATARAIDALRARKLHARDEADGRNDRRGRPTLTAEAMPLLRDISRNGPRIHELTERLVALEGEADDVHAAASRRPSRACGNPMQFIVAREIYKHLERITDAFEDVANEIDEIVIDHA